MPFGSALGVTKSWVESYY